MNILITGTAGFIGHQTALKLCAMGHTVIGIDSLNDYYDVRLKFGRLQNSGIIKDIEEGSSIRYGEMMHSESYPDYSFCKLNLEDKDAVFQLFTNNQFDAVCNLAAQAGVRYSLENPYAYIESNVLGFMNILEACRHFGVRNLSYASSSSVYGLNDKVPFSTKDNTDHPISLYAATKKSNEMMAHTYSHLFGISTTGLRFFTVYGPWSRPDMAPFLFTKAAIEGRAIDVFNNGNMFRDFTYIDDIVEGVIRVILNPAQPAEFDQSNPATSSAPFKIYNIGNNSPVKLMDFIKAIENKLGKEIEKNMKPIQPGDVFQTYADTSELVNDMGYKPATDIQEGINRFIDWYIQFYDVKQ